jgi:sulfhydrogenase subunit alpha
VAQLIETVHCADDARAVITSLLETGLEPEGLDGSVREGHGVGAVEVPRGTLYHEYAVDRHGMITDANLIIPTGQNLANLESDMWALAPEVIPKGQAAAQKAMEMLVRAYDPCISCSTHVIYLDRSEKRRVRPSSVTASAGPTGRAPGRREGEA